MDNYHYLGDIMKKFYANIVSLMIVASTASLSMAEIGFPQKKDLLRLSQKNHVRSTDAITRKQLAQFSALMNNKKAQSYKTKRIPPVLSPSFFEHAKMVSEFHSAEEEALKKIAQLP